MATPVSQYFARVAIDVDQTSLKKVDEYFKSLETKMKRYQGKIGNGLRIKVAVDIDSRATLLNMRRKLDMLGQNLTLTVKKLQFAINGKQIRSQAERQLSAGIRVKVTPWVTRNTVLDLRRQIQAGLQNLPVTVKYAGNLRASLMSRINQFITPAARPQRGSTGGSGRSGGGGSSSGFPSYNGLTRGPLGMALRYGSGSIPFVGGVWGVDRLNQANTDYVSQKIAANGIFADKLPGGGNAARQQLFNLAQLNGIDYKDTLPNFSRFMASAMPSMGYDGGFNSFRSILEFGRARGATSESLERALYAFSQIAGKGKVMSEELFGQLSEASGFGESGDIFARAYAQKTNSGLTGQKAQAALRDAMKGGKVLSAELLPIVAQIMSEMAAPSLAASRNTADAKQMRFRNSRGKFMASFSESGGEAALGRMWESLDKSMASLGRRAPQLATAFAALVSGFDKVLDVVMDLSNTLFFGEESRVSRSIKDETGINLVAIANGVNAIAGMLGGIYEKLGFGGSAAALLGAYGLGKVGTTLLKNKAGQVLSDKTGGLLGTSNNLSAYAVPGVGALKVWVVNGGSDFGSLPGPSGKSGTPPNNPTKGRKLPGWLGAGLIGAMALPTIAGGLSYMHPNQNSVGVTSDFGTLGGADAAMQQLYGPSADQFVNKNKAQVAPIVEQAKVQANVQHSINLKADIKLEAGTPQEALDQFKLQLKSDVFEPFMLGALKEAQSTFSDYAR